MVNVITLLTDFGTCDSYVAQLKGVLLRRAADPLQIVDICHEVPPQDIGAAARLLREAAMEFPAGTVHVAVVDPGVGTSRRIVAAEIEQQRFVLPDNGLLSLVLDDFPVGRVRVVENEALWLETVSPTFHGRDIMAPVALFLAEGGDVLEVGAPAGELQRLSHSSGKLVADKWSLEVIAIDRFGNAITNGSAELRQWLGESRALVVELQGVSYEVDLVRTYGEAEPGRLVSLFGSRGQFELALVNGSAADHLSLDLQEEIKIRRE